MTVHIIGAGMAGLSAALALTEKGIPVKIYEASNHAGGRCYSFYDKHLDAVLDNGTHLMFGANTALLKMLGKCQEQSPLQAIKHDFLFCRIRERTFFNVDLKNPFKALLRLPEIYGLSAASIMNTPASQADSFMLLKTALKCLGTENSQVYLASPSLKASIVDPVEKYLKEHQVPFLFHKKLRYVREDKLVFFDGDVPLASQDKVILALPSFILCRTLVGAPELPHQTIINIHYKSDAALPDNRSFVGMTGGTGHWVFARNGILSVTISAADSLISKYHPNSIAVNVWSELTHFLNVSGKVPLFRVIADRQATLMQSRNVNALRLNTDIGSNVLFLAGDGTATGLPCTIEGAVRSGIAAAQKIIHIL